MKKIAQAIAVFVAFGITGCSSSNVDEVKQKSNEVWRQAGFEVVGYEGWEKGGYLGGSYGGAFVWYTLKRIPDNGIIYHGSIQRWGDEYHIYALSALDAIRPENSNKERK